MQNIETLDGMGVRKIITQCPHCFNTLGNEYPQLGGNYEVVHHSQFLEQLIADGRLDLEGARLEERVVEATANGTKGMCCGAGGARMWMEESIGAKVNDVRSQQLIATGATRIATACPFCYIMIDDGVKAQGLEDDDVKVGDIAMHVLDAIESSEAARDATTPSIPTV
jgi:Fe-S oxidoreductase